MQVHGNYHIHCRLKEIMTERGITVEQLHHMARVGRGAISSLRVSNFQGFNQHTIAKVCGALKIGVGDLLVNLPRDIWLPIILGKEVTFHVGAQAEPQSARCTEEALLNRERVGLWDLRAMKCIWDHLSQTSRDIRMQFREHVTGPGRVRAAAQAIFERGNHVVLASPIANAFTEQVVCHAFGVPPCDPNQGDRFPYGFRWDNRRMVPSSFGTQGHDNQFGIVALPSNKIVAEHVLVPVGSGKDCALIVVYRIFQAPALREFGDDDEERIVICLLGYGGPGTFAAAQLAIDPEYAFELYPAARHVPRMRTVATEVLRQRTEFGEDNRQIKDVKLVPEHKPRKAPRKSPSGRGPSGSSPPDEFGTRRLQLTGRRVKRRRIG